MSWLRRLWCRVRGHRLTDSWLIEGPYAPGMVVPAHHVWRCWTCTPSRADQFAQERQR